LSVTDVQGSFIPRLLAATFVVLFTSPAVARTIKPCVPGEPAQVAAGKELQAIDRAVRKLAPGDDPAALVARIEQLGATKCFEIIFGVGVAARSGLSLQTYWAEGGFSRLEATLALGGPKGRRVFWTEPSVRRALTLETAPTSPIAAMLCRARDEACGAETAGWQLRADALFELDAQVQRLRNSRDEPDNCEKAAQAAPRAQQFLVWRDCFVSRQEEVAPRIGFPIGQTRPPQQGWLVVTGRRGHYDFCDEVRAYDLATGAAYVVGSCSALALEANGKVNAAKTNSARRRTIQLGHLPVPYLREAAWMMLLLDELDPRVRVAVGSELPAWLEVSVDDARDEGEERGIAGRVMGFSTSQTRLRWQLVGADRLGKTGTLTFPDATGDVAEDHAMRLLRIAEMGFVAGCPAAQPPALPANLLSDGASLAASWKQAQAQQAACRAK
jgi:hypothetical protein